MSTKGSKKPTENKSKTKTWSLCENCKNYFVIENKSDTSQQHECSPYLEDLLSLNNSKSETQYFISQSSRAHLSLVEHPKGRKFNL
jgi:hypothetical protein